MEFKGTPAPWESLTATELELPSGIIKSGEKSIAYTLQKEVGAEQAKANAHLIAAAPELLEQLIRLRNKIASYKPDDDDDLDIVDAVIAKALG
ncbi:hypothetical protein ACA538_004109 [Proteus mirabilis]|uniref:hypothetical protein n=1 Tax=Proteus mirabilis TaxID=584 RepID=UPI0018C80491|nr:hypothetical protein [Proteus mirabilis]EKT8413148.1 hypothetical protein [Proteus mirabilis]EKU7618931.1 hypothetical protein [Proteus mirabilis]ELT7779741.1 hypothetical protein [Proteus mirabilis]MBG2831699.1 hypothetical protein [Proteus mirabilis]HEK0693862.1 hypothetical protein [Proteus mirabilis]